jgi:hypothetical protein
MLVQYVADAPQIEIIQPISVTFRAVEGRVQRRSPWC